MTYILAVIKGPDYGLRVVGLTSDEIGSTIADLVESGNEGFRVITSKPVSPPPPCP